MPTVIALDLSLSMSRPAVCSSGKQNGGLISKRRLGITAIHQFLDHISTHCKLEFLALLTFSSECRVITESFTRNVDVIRELLDTLEENDNTNYEAILGGIASTVLKQWSNTLPVEIFLITDGSPGYGPGCLRNAIEKAKRFPFPTKMNILSLSDPEEKNFTENIKMLQQLIEVTSGEGSVYLPENQLNAKGVGSAVARLCAKDFTPYKGVLRCGQLSSKITLCPPPQPFVSRSEEKRYDISEVIEIVGFIDLNDLASPSAHSRHLLLPLKATEAQIPSSAGESMSVDDDVDGNLPNFCVLLHGSLKVENFCAICEVGPDWFGFIYSWADNKKKSNLMLSILPPGAEVVSWLGNMRQLGPKTEELRKVAGSQAQLSFPVKQSERRSYVSNPTVWLNGDDGLYSDIQKLLRHARKLPEKTPQFYKELNRMRRWALTLGFIDVLEKIALILERECLVSTSPIETTIELTHAIAEIRTVLDYNKSIIPMATLRHGGVR